MCLTSLRLQYQDCLRPQACFYNAHSLCQKVVSHLFLLSFWFHIQADTTLSRRQEYLALVISTNCLKFINCLYSAHCKTVRLCYFYVRLLFVSYDIAKCRHLYSQRWLLLLYLDCFGTINCRVLYHILPFYHQADNTSCGKSSHFIVRAFLFFCILRETYKCHNAADFAKQIS